MAPCSVRRAAARLVTWQSVCSPIVVYMCIDIYIYIYIHTYIHIYIYIYNIIVIIINHIENDNIVFHADLELRSSGRRTRPSPGTCHVKNLKRIPMKEFL